MECFHGVLQGTARCSGFGCFRDPLPLILPLTLPLTMPLASLLRWDYGYQISGIANRTTLADGNTWNLEHISLIARCLTSKEKRAHELIRHLADYVLVWAGGQVRYEGRRKRGGGYGRLKSV